MQKIEILEVAIGEALKDLRLMEVLNKADQKERLKANIYKLHELVGQVHNYYRDTYEIDKPSTEKLAKARQVWELREQGLGPNEICKRAKVNRGQLYYLLADWQRWGLGKLPQGGEGVSQNEKLLTAHVSCFARPRKDTGE